VTTKVFGMFVPGESLGLRSFEVYFGIGSRGGVGAWRSAYPSVQNLLDHLWRYTQSEASRVKYLRHLYQFCRWCGLGPEELTRLPKERAEQLVQSFADSLAMKGSSRAYVNTVIKRLRTFFRVNGYVGARELRVKSFFVPTRYRKVPEYILTKDEVYRMADAAGKLRDRAVILVLWSSGLRVSTLCALNYGDVAEEVESGEPYIMIPVYPEMKEHVPDACKGRIPYYTFICPEAGEALRAYLKERAEKYGRLGLEEPLFHSQWNQWPGGERPKRRLNRRTIGVIIKKATKLAGIKRWRHVTPHCLRKAFESVLRSSTMDGGRLDKGTQEFFMGYILPGTQDVYYDKTKIEFHREEYAKLNFSRGRPRHRTVDKLISLDELEEHLNEGWLFIAKVSEDKVVVRRESN